MVPNGLCVFLSVKCCFLEFLGEFHGMDPILAVRLGHPLCEWGAGSPPQMASLVRHPEAVSWSQRGNGPGLILLQIISFLKVKMNQMAFKENRTHIRFQLY